jgi:hypothetical protein
MAQFFTQDDEKRLRELATGIARAIEDPQGVIKRLGFTPGDYEELADTRMFKQMLGEAIAEWQGAANTHKRIKMKAAVSIEEALPSFYTAMTNAKEPLSSKVKALEVVARIGGLGNPEIQAPGAGQFFKLEINLGQGIAPMVLANGVESLQGPGMTIDHEAVAAALASVENDEGAEYTPVQDEDHYSPSKLFDDLPLEEL